MKTTSRGEEPPDAPCLCGHTAEEHDPVAVVLIWIDLATRREIAGGAKLAWALFSLIPIVPFLYVLTGGDLW